MSRDPYQVLDVKANATDAEIRAAYHRLVLRYHPDHNNGSPESARKFEEVQEAYAQIRQLRERTPPPPRPTGADPDMDTKLEDLERQVREAQTARERAARRAAEARRQARIATTDARERAGRPSDEELGYVATDDSFGKILADARTQLGSWLEGADDVITDARQQRAGKRISDLIDELEAKLRRGRQH